MDHFTPWLQTCPFHWTWNKIQISFHVLQVPTWSLTSSSTILFLLQSSPVISALFLSFKKYKALFSPQSLHLLFPLCGTFSSHLIPTRRPFLCHPPQLFKCLIHSHLSAKNNTSSESHLWSLYSPMILNLLPFILLGFPYSTCHYLKVPDLFTYSPAYVRLGSLSHIPLYPQYLEHA